MARSRFGDPLFGESRFADAESGVTPPLTFQIGKLTEHDSLYQLIGTGAPAVAVAVKFERPPTRLHYRIRRGDGSNRRWGPHEEARNIPQGTVFTDKDPGGFAELSNRLGRDIFRAYDDLNPFDEVEVYGPGVSSAWEGRFMRFPRESESKVILPSAVGHAAHLRDDASAREVYVDADMTHWQEPPLSQKLALATGGVSLGDFSWGLDGGLLMAALPNQAIGGNSTAMIWWLGPAGVRAASVIYKGGDVSIGVGGAAGTGAGSPGSGSTPGANYERARFLAYDAEDAAAAEAFYLEMDSTLRAATFTAGHQFVGTDLYTNSTPATPGPGAHRRFESLWMYGDHGLPRISNGSWEGYYGHDIVADILRRWAPLLRFTTGPQGSIKDDKSFVMPHFLVGWDKPVRAEDALLALNAFYLHSWGVWEGKEAFWRPTSDVPRIWNARRSEGATLKLEGPQGDDHFNGVMVSFTDPNGRRRTAGPPGAPADYTDASLVDTNPANPVNAHGIPRRWGELDIEQVTNSAGAIKAGAAWLALSGQRNQQGTLVVVRDCEDSTGARWPAWRMRAGEYVRLQDGDQTLRRIISKSYDHDSLRVTLDLDVPANRLSALLERMGVVLVGVI